MKIICSEHEMAHLVRMCALNERENACRGCLLECVCTKGEELYEGAWFCQIEDICEVAHEGVK